MRETSGDLKQIRVKLSHQSACKRTNIDGSMKSDSFDAGRTFSQGTSFYGLVFSVLILIFFWDILAGAISLLLFLLFVFRDRLRTIIENNGTTNDPSIKIDKQERFT